VSESHPDKKGNPDKKGGDEIMGKYIFCMLPGSRHSQEAKELLESRGIPVTTIVLDGDSLNAVSYDLGIKKAPALYVKGRWYQGIKEIREFVNGK